MKCCITPIRSIALLALSLAVPAIANEPVLVRTDRYTLETLAPTGPQKDLLSAITEIRFPPRVVNVGDAIDYLLHRTGYQHIRTQQSTPALALPLPQVHRHIGPIDVRSALRILVGPKWKIQENQIARAVWVYRASAAADEPELPLDQIQGELPVETQAVLRTLEAQDSNRWTLHENTSLRASLTHWVEQIAWQLEWNSRHDYVIAHQYQFEGSFYEAVADVLEHYQDASIPLVARFYNDNRVLLIDTYHSQALTP